MLDHLETWIDQHLDDMETTEEKLETARVAEDVTAIGALVFGEVKQKSDIMEIVWLASIVGFPGPEVGPS